MLEDVVIKLAETEEERQAAFHVRMQVFVEEQGIPVEEELDQDDGAATHVIALMGTEAVGTGRVVYLESGEARIGRMAVEKAWRRRGIGSRILERLEEEARRRGTGEAILHAQTNVKSFYAAHGYVQEGEVFLEVGIEHVSMSKPL